MDVWVSFTGLGFSYSVRFGFKFIKLQKTNSGVFIALLHITKHKCRQKHLCKVKDVDLKKKQKTRVGDVTIPLNLCKTLGAYDNNQNTCSLCELSHKFPPLK